MKNVQFTASTVLRLSALATALALAGCGGGGSSSPSGSNTGTGGTGTVITCTAPQVLVNGVCSTPSPTVTPANLQTSVPTPTYQADSVELRAFTELNNFRKMVGLGLLVQNSKIDLAAANHANYIAVNIDADSSIFGGVDSKYAVFGHFEVATKLGFTGVAPGDRTLFTGYGPRASEVVTTNNYADKNSPVQSFMGTVYHRSALLTQCPKDVGIGFKNHIGANNMIWSPVVIDLGFNPVSGCQTNASDFVYSYPVANQTNVPVAMLGETPKPFDVAKNQYGGDDWENNTSYPISIGVYDRYALTMESMVVTEQGSTTPLQMRAINNSNDANKFIQKNEIVFVGIAPFKPSTTYNIVFKGAANGTPITKAFSMTTAAAN